jgi:hypothetical protein
MAQIIVVSELTLFHRLPSTVVYCQVVVMLDWHWRTRVDVVVLSSDKNTAWDAGLNESAGIV